MMKSHHLYLFVLVFVIAGCAVLNPQTAEPLSSSQSEPEAKQGVSSSSETEPSTIPSIVDPNQGGSDFLEDPILRPAISDLTDRLNIAEDEIEKGFYIDVEWPDASLGCPMPGAMYAQVITPGYQIFLQVGDKLYAYHANEENTIVLCGEDGEPMLPRIPIHKGDEIKDGDPWMPVDPIPTANP